MTPLESDILTFAWFFAPLLIAVAIFDLRKENWE